MKTKRLFLRERTKKAILDIKEKTVEEQFLFFGCTTQSELNTHLQNAERLLRPNKAPWIMWDIVELNTNTVVGTCDFHNWFEEHQRAELGYMLNDKQQGKGFMHEALHAIFDYGFTKLNLNRIEAFIGTSNQKSINVVSKFSFKKEGLLREHYKFNGVIHDSLVYALLKKEYTEFCTNS